MVRHVRLALPADPISVQRARKDLWNEARSAENADFYTVGYTGRGVTEVIGLLRGAGVLTLIDVRHAPVSMYNPDFSRSGLRRHVEAAGLRYLHLAELGVPRDIRALAMRHQSREVIWDWYDMHVVSRFFGRNLDSFFNLAEHPVAFMCVELDPSACHRHRLFVALEERGLQGFDL